MNRIMSPLQLGNSGPTVADLQIGLRFLIDTGFFGSGIPDPSPEAAQSFYGDVTKGLVETFQKLVGLDTDGIVNAATATTLNDRLAGLDRARSIVGRVTLEDGRSVEGITLVLKRAKFRNEPAELTRAITRAGGRYALSFDPGPGGASLQIVALRDTDEGPKEVPLVAQLNYLGSEPRVTRNLVFPGELEPRVAEFRRLAADLRPHIGDIARLAKAQETADRPDITAVSRAASVDARLIAQGALAGRLSTGTPKITQEAFYGLLRAGLPSDSVLLAQVTPDAAAATLTAVRDAGIIAMSDDAIKDFRESFQEFSTDVRLTLPVPGGNTSYGELLAATNLTEEKQKAFANVYLEYGGDPGQLWQQASAKGLTAGEIGQLQLQGKLAVLTGSSGQMTGRLMAKQVSAGGAAPLRPLSDPVQLVELGFYKAATWAAELDEVSSDPEIVDALIPSAYVGSQDYRRQAYTEDMARELRRAYPMQVLAQEIRTDEENAFVLGTASAPAAQLLHQAAGQGFRLGQTPVDAFLAAHPGVADGLTPDESAAGKAVLKDLQRTYQISPSDDAMKVMRRNGLFAAQDVTSMTKSAFLDHYGHHFASQREAELIYRKAEQVSSVVHNLFTMASQIESQVVVYGTSAPAEVRQSVKGELTKHFPTLEKLFGSQDFCECEHCRSVLSPAAYLVDLLQFVEGEDAARAGFEASWKRKHIVDGQEQSYGSQYKLPYDALKERRPDLIHIPLTCENTHTALPYIDIVNEILEYFVANGALAPDAARDTGEATTAELLAEPQNVIRKAYEAVRDAHYPLTLPFDLWLEMVRQFCNFFETPLARVLEAFRPGDELFVPTQTFDRAAIFIEYLGLSSTEAALFADPNPLGGGKWYELFGFAATGPAIANPTNQIAGATLTLPNDEVPFAVGDLVTYLDVSTGEVKSETLAITEIGAADSGVAGRRIIVFDGQWATRPDRGDRLIVAAPALLASAKTLARRLGVTYKELVAIVETGFVNPKLASLILLYKLGMTVSDVFFYEEKLALYEGNKDLLGENAKPEDLSPANKKRYDALSLRDPITKRTGWEDLGAVQAILDRLAAASLEFAPFDAIAWLEKALKAKVFDDVLVLADPNAGCSFDETTLRYARGRPADDIVFLRINLFTRLWRKLGWTIEETDRALTTFTPHNAPFDTGHLNLRPLQTVLIYLAHLKALLAKLSVGKDARLKMLTFWSDLPTTGKKSLYAQLFLTRSILKTDAVFDDPLGRYLTKFAADQTNVEPGNELDPNSFAGHPNVSVHYDRDRKIQWLVYEGFLSDDEKVEIQKLAPGSSDLATLLDRVQASSRIGRHMPALQSALGLTTDEIGRILTDDGKSLGTAELSLPNVSLLYRYALLAKGLKLTVSELIALKQLSGRNPFKPLHPDPLASLVDDHPFSQTLEFVKVAGEVKESGLALEDLDYLLRHRFDPTGKYRLDTASTVGLLKAMADGVRAIRTENAVPADPAALSDEVLRQKLGLVLPADVATQLLAMLNGTAEFTATVSVTSDEATLALATFADEPSIVTISPRDTVHNQQKLTYRGVLFEKQQERLVNLFEDMLKTEQKTTFADLLTGVRAEARAFFDKNLKKQAADGPPAYGFLEDVDDRDYNLLFNTDLVPDLSRRRARLADAFLPFLQARLSRQFILQTLAAYSGADPILVESLLTDARLLGMPPGEGKRPLLDLFAGLGERGLDAAFFDSSDLSGPPQPSAPLVTSADTALKDKKDKNGNELDRAASARFEGYLEVPAAGPYRFFAVLDNKGAQVELRFDHLPEPVVLQGAAAKAGYELSALLELKPGLLYRFTLKLESLDGGNARLLVQSETLPKDRLAQLVLHPAAALLNAERGLTLLAKALQLLQSLGLSEREARYVLTHAADFGGIDLSMLLVEETDGTRHGARFAPAAVTKALQLLQSLGLSERGARELLIHAADFEGVDLALPSAKETQDPFVAAQKRFDAFLRLAAYARLKRELAGGTDDLIAIFEANGTTAGDKLDKLVYPLIARLTRRDQVSVKETSEYLFAAPAFASEESLRRLWEALQVVERFGVPVASVVEWTGIVAAAATDGDRFAIARDLRESIKARFEPEAWQRVARPIFDRLRQRQRDALAAHVMHTRGFERLEQFYEFFLIDPGMEPVVQTSRIRLAIASVQLFIQRCLLNLEEKVHPSAILNPEHWEWMKRYRVWEANRKIFLFPENWLEPEFRDDKSHLFTDLEGALLQGDVSNDLVEDAFLDYLRKLEELARLDIVAMHLEQRDDPGQNVLHVFGRTSSQPPKYFYRRLTLGMWTPWEPVTADIQGDHLAPVIWRNRLYLFWVTFMEKPRSNKKPIKIPAGGECLEIPDGPIDLRAQLNWSEYLKGEWSVHESSAFDSSGAITFRDRNLSDINGIFIYVSKEYDADGEEQGVFVHLAAPAISSESVVFACRLEEECGIPEEDDESDTGSEGGNTNGGGTQCVTSSATLFVEPQKSAFYLAGRNSSPVKKDDGQPAPANTYPTAQAGKINRYEGVGSLAVTFHQRISTEPGKTTAVTPSILNRVGRYALLPLNHTLGLRVSEEAYKNPENPERSEAVKEALENSRAEIESLIAPLFFQDNAHTFFVEPNVVERTIEDWQTWAPPTPPPGNYEGLPWLDWVHGNVLPVFTKGESDSAPTVQDWLVNPLTIIRFDNQAIGALGGVPLTFVPAAAAPSSGAPVQVNSAGAIGAAEVAVLGGGLTLEQVGLTDAAGGLHVIGAGGVNVSLMQNVERFSRNGSSARRAGVIRQ